MPPWSGAVHCGLVRIDFPAFCDILVTLTVQKKLSFPISYKITPFSNHARVRETCRHCCNISSYLYLISVATSLFFAVAPQYFYRLRPYYPSSLPKMALYRVNPAG